LNSLITFRISKAALSAFATLVGILVGIVAMRMLGFEHASTCAFMISIVAVPVWLLVLLPLAIWLPSSSRLWHPLICTVVGALAGGAMLVVGFGLWPGAGLDLAAGFAPIGAIVGGVTCLVGSTAARYFHGTQQA
jgi:hypothetical protein